MQESEKESEWEIDENGIESQESEQKSREDENGNTLKLYLVNSIFLFSLSLECFVLLVSFPSFSCFHSVFRHFGNIEAKPQDKSQNEMNK